MTCQKVVIFGAARNPRDAGLLPCLKKIFSLNYLKLLLCPNSYFQYFESLVVLLWIVATCLSFVPLRASSWCNLIHRILVGFYSCTVNLIIWEVRFRWDIILLLSDALFNNLPNLFAILIYKVIGLVSLFFFFLKRKGLVKN